MPRSQKHTMVIVLGRVLLLSLCMTGIACCGWDECSLQEEKKTLRFIAFILRAFTGGRPEKMQPATDFPVRSSFSHRQPVQCRASIVCNNSQELLKGAAMLPGKTMHQSRKPYRDWTKARAVEGRS